MGPMRPKKRREAIASHRSHRSRKPSVPPGRAGWKACPTRGVNIRAVTAILGRLCQLIGLLLLPIGLSYGLLKDNIGVEVRLLFIGGAFFVLGWLMSRQRKLT